MPVIPGFMRLMQENLEFKAILGYIARPYFKKKKTNNKYNWHNAGATWVLSILGRSGCHDSFLVIFLDHSS
jgi:hypothetical protein